MPSDSPTATSSGVSPSPAHTRPSAGRAEAFRLITKWRLQDEKDDDVREAIQQCADELEVAMVAAVQPSDASRLITDVEAEITRVAVNCWTPPLARKYVTLMRRIHGVLCKQAVAKDSAAPTLESQPEVRGVDNINSRNELPE